MNSLIFRMCHRIVKNETGPVFNLWWFKKFHSDGENLNVISRTPLIFISGSMWFMIGDMKNCPGLYAEKL